MEAEPTGADGPNMYHFNYFNPINRFDPSGLSSFWQHFGPPDDGVAGTRLGPGIGCAASAMIRNFQHLHHDNTIGNDKYFHCKAHCEAAQCPDGGRLAGYLFGQARENRNSLDDHFKGFPGDRAEDVEANNHGLKACPSTDCKQHCDRFRVRGIKERY